MRIIYIQQHFRYPTEKGGSRPYEQALRLAAAGHEVHVITTVSDAQQAGWHTKYVSGFKVHSYSLRYDQKMNYADRIAAFLKFALVSTTKARSLGGDLIYASSTPLTVAVPGMLASVFPNKPFIFEVRDLWPDLPIAFGALRNPIARKLARLLEISAYRRASHIVALSPDMKDRISELTGGSKPITVIPNAADTNRFRISHKDGKQWVADNLGLPLDRPLATYAGVFGEANRVDFFVDVAKHLKNMNSKVAILLIGDGKEKAGVIEAAYSSGCYNKNLFISDPISKEEIALVYGGSDVILSSLAPLKELGSSSPNKVFDAFAAGKPVAINYSGWLAKVLEQSGAGISTDFDPIQYAVALDRFMADKNSLIESSKASSHLGQVKFNRDHLVAMLLGVLSREYAATIKNDSNRSVKK